jgi:hypothetical protein
MMLMIAALMTVLHWGEFAMSQRGIISIVKRLSGEINPLNNPLLPTEE